MLWPRCERPWEGCCPQAERSALLHAAKESRAGVKIYFDSPAALTAPEMYCSLCLSAVNTTVLH